MKIKVEAKGVLQGISDIIKGLSGLLDKVFKGLEDEGMKVVDRKVIPESQGGGEVVTIKSDKLMGEPFSVKITPVEDGIVDLEFECKSLKKIDGKIQKGVKSEDIDKIINQWGADNVKNFNTNASRSLKVTLQRVTANKEDNIELLAINANYHIKAALDSLDAVLDDEEFLSEVTEEPITFEITDSDDLGFMDVEPIEEIGEVNGYADILAACATLHNNLKMMHWNAKGKGFNNFHNKLNDWSYQSMWDMDNLGELCVEKMGSSPNPGLILSCEGLLPSNTECTEEEGYLIINTIMTDYITALETYYVNFEHDVQSSLDNMIRFWRKERDYHVTRAIKE